MKSVRSDVNGVRRCPVCGEPMNPSQLTCFACAADPRERQPSRARALKTVVPMLATVAWLLLVAALLLPRIGNRSRHDGFLGTGHSPGRNSGQSGTASEITTTERRRLLRGYERQLDAMLARVMRLREMKTNRTDSTDLVLDWAENQLLITGRLLEVLTVSGDSETVCDIRDFLDRRLEHIEGRIRALGH